MRLSPRREKYKPSSDEFNSNTDRNIYRGAGETTFSKYASLVSWFYAFNAKKMKSQHCNIFVFY